MMQPSITLAHSSQFNPSLAAPWLPDNSQEVIIEQPEDQQRLHADVLLITEDLLQQAPLERWCELDCCLLASDSLLPNEQAGNEQSLLIYPQQATSPQMQQMIVYAHQLSRLHRQNQQLKRQAQQKEDDLQRVVSVGIALSSEPDLQRLLAKILNQGQDLLGCDAASLFLIDQQSSPQQLIFKLTHNRSVDVPFEEQHLPLNTASIAGYCALTGQSLNIHDAYNLDESLPCQFNRSFDLAMGYRTVNMAALPMVDHDQNIVGVLQFINRKHEPSAILDNPIHTPEQITEFDDNAIALLQALASQAAVAIENRKLLDDVNRLFDGFVQASVFAIEQRDPTTSGHSFRVADLCEAVARCVDASESSALKQCSFNEEQMRELRYAAMLHDFGKVGVREHVLTKAKKLPTATVELLRYRVALAQAHLQRQSLEQQLNLATSSRGLSPDERLQFEHQLATNCRQLDEYLDYILEANEPSILKQGTFDHLETIKTHLVYDHRGKLGGLISEEEFAALSIRKGSLTDAERLEIESHVRHTINFLSLIPWTSNLQGIPAIAGAHHEKLDGSGYPYHLNADQIPLPSRIMTVCDIYDALTASDRPYKPAMPIEKALAILEYEASDGMLDSDMVHVFIEGRCYEALKGRKYGFKPPMPAAGCSHHVCDPEFHKH